MFRRARLLALLLLATLLPLHVQRAHATPLWLCVVGAPRAVAADDAPGVFARGFFLGTDYAASVLPDFVYVGVYVILYNTGNTPLAYSPADFTLVDLKTDNVYHPDQLDPVLQSFLLGSGTLAPHSYVAGALSFPTEALEDILASYALHWTHSRYPVPWACAN